MVKVRITRGDDPAPRRQPKAEPKPDPESPAQPVSETTPTVRAPRGMSERQWFISLLLAAALLLLITFRGCILPSGVGPKAQPVGKPTPAEQTAPPEAKTESGGEYTVQPGDTLGKIAREHGTTAAAIAEANDIPITTILRVGQKLRIP